MKTILVTTLLLSLALVFTACNKEVEAPAPHEVQILTTVAISDAESLYLVGSPTSKSDIKTTQLYKITAQGQDKTIVFSDQKGDSINFNVVGVWPISSNYIFILGRIIIDYSYNSTSDIPSFSDNESLNWYLVRKSDNVVFELKEYGRTIAGNLGRTPSTLIIDSENSIYWAHYSYDFGTPTKLYKMNLPEQGDEITAAAISGDLGWFVWWTTMDRNDVMLIGLGEVLVNDVVCRFPDGSFVKYEVGGKLNSNNKYLALRQGAGGFLVLEEDNTFYYKTKITRIIPDVANKRLNYETIATTDKHIRDYVCNALLDGSYVLRSVDYKEYLFIDANGNIETKSYETGFAYGNSVLSNNCIYGAEGSSIYVMNFDTRDIKCVFSDNRYRIDKYQISPNNDYLDIYGLRYADARKVLLRVDASGQIIKETLQTDNNAEIITFIRLN